MAVREAPEKPGLASPSSGPSMPGVMWRVIMLFGFLARLVSAHQIDEIVVELEATPEGFRATVAADAAYMLPENRGDADVAPMDLAWLRQLPPAEWERVREETSTYLRESLVFRVDGEVIPVSLSFPDFDPTPPRFVTEGLPESLPMLEVEIEGAFRDGVLSAAWEEAFGVVLIVQTSEQTIPIVSGYEEPLLQSRADGSTAVVAPTLGGWVVLGFRHIIPNGLDHVLFILGIFLLIPRWKPLLGQSLIFTLAHSLTLGLAAIGWIALPERWVELAIAASIAWIGLENLWLKSVDWRRYLLVGVFGLIHGVGFARMLLPFLPADQPDALLAALAGFNVGVELGQILVLAIAFSLTCRLKEESFAKVRGAASILIAAAGVVMIAQRLG